MFISANSGLDAINPVTGEILWSYQGPPPAATPQPTTVSPNARPVGVAPAAPTALNVSGGLSSRDESYGQRHGLCRTADGSVVAVTRENRKGDLDKPRSLPPERSAGTRAASRRLLRHYAPIGKDGIVIRRSLTTETLRCAGTRTELTLRQGALLWWFFTTPDPNADAGNPHLEQPVQAAFGGGVVWTERRRRPRRSTRVYIEHRQHLSVHRKGHPEKDLGMIVWRRSTRLLVKLKWHYQQVHHDIWDYDEIETPRNSVQRRRSTARCHPAIAQGNKDGWLFVATASTVRICRTSRSLRSRFLISTTVRGQHSTAPGHSARAFGRCRGDRGRLSDGGTGQVCDPVLPDRRKWSVDGAELHVRDAL